ncbi:MAG: TetR/AcrR family transcriptional regulator [Ignavibacteriaceae bacterium]|nr:TetR/AcrR family transcriptional regulator [Ignavibacterium sp.]MCC6256646.1 TetR/AcrR family transcriptional regulator [Ignavibacteriaceae bacterium]HRN24971.1 TetR/AcrR family transcriptional regulator [Ignavibacteriaceae bacterium]HRP93576.1 TetR/AcrR family transcriptional regulator [Ignavibacteriaceae bacterium]HRQ52649.1 TetR/AcrR family transcriptional regulator [Ignavibacteriaceae bacterium]
MVKAINNTEGNSSKSEQLAKTAYKLFMRHGIRRVSVEEICKEAKISKMTFYKIFPNKIELAKYILDKIFSEQMDVYRNTMKEKIPFARKVEKIILQKNKSTESLSEEFFKDLTKNPIAEIAELIKRFQQTSLDEVMKDLKSAQKKGEIRKNINLDFIVYFLNRIPDLMNEKKLNSIYNTPNELIMELTNFFFYGILTNKAEE